MKKEYEEIKNALLKLSKLSERELENISDTIDDIIKYNIKDERTISEVNVFHKLSNYCKKFDKNLADDYDEILEEYLSYDIDEE